MRKALARSIMSATTMGILTFLVGCFGSDGAADNVVAPQRQLGVTTVAFAPDGRCVVSESGDWKLITLPEGDIKAVLVEKGGNPTAAKFSADGRFLAAVSGSVVRVWRASDGHKLMQAIAEGTPAPRLINVALSPDGKYVAVSSITDDNLFIWRVSDGHLIARRDDEPYHVFGWTSDGLLMVGSVLRVHNDKVSEVRPFQKALYLKAPLDLWPSEDGEFVAVNYMGSASIHNLREGTSRTLQLPHGGMTNLAWSPDKKTIALRYQTGDSVRGPHIRSFVEVRRVQDGALLHFMQVGTSKNGTDAYGTLLSISSDGKWLVSEGRNSMGLWDMRGWVKPIPEPTSQDAGLVR